jgi:SAM-dependent methyltransferase
MDVFEKFKAAQKTGWAHFAPLQSITTIPAARLVKHARISPGSSVLDVACGTGVVAITAARRGAQVTGLDLSPDLLEVARSNAATAEVKIAWHEGDVESLPFDAATFDTVVSQFGHIFAPRPDVAVAEMLRVLKPGGTLAFSTWPPELFTGRVFALLARYLPPMPPEIASPPQWGEVHVIRARLGSAVRDLFFDRAAMLNPSLSPQHHRQVSERTSGPVRMLVESLSSTDPEKLAAFRREYDALVSEYFEDNTVRQNFLMTRAVKI